jgi:hypothetical protein
LSLDVDGVNYFRGIASGVLRPGREHERHLRRGFAVKRSNSTAHKRALEVRAAEIDEELKNESEVPGK